MQIYFLPNFLFLNEKTDSPWVVHLIALDHPFWSRGGCGSWAGFSEVPSGPKSKGPRNPRDLTPERDGAVVRTGIGAIAGIEAQPAAAEAEIRHAATGKDRARKIHVDLVEQCRLVDEAVEADGEGAECLSGVMVGANIAGCPIGVLLSPLDLHDRDAFGGHDALEVGALVRVGATTVDGNVGYLAEEAGAGAEVADGDVDEANLSQLELPLKGLDDRHHVVAVLVHNDIGFLRNANLDELVGLETEHLLEVLRYCGPKLQTCCGHF